MQQKRKSKRNRFPALSNNVAKKFVAMAKVIQTGVDNMEQQGVSTEEYIVYSNELMHLEEELKKLDDKVRRLFYKTELDTNG